jgi:hypothetical protein
VFPFGLTVTLIGKTVTGVDSYNDDVYGTTSTTVAGCLYAPGGSVDLVQGQEQVITQPTLYMPTGTDVTAVDQITVPGFGTFEVDGPPQVWPPHPRTGWQPTNSVVVRLKQVTG